MASEAEWLSMVTLGFGSFTFGMIPIKLPSRARQRHPLLLSLLLCVGGGVLLATSLVHMLSEAREGETTNVELFYSIGFLTLYLFDELVHLWLGDDIVKVGHKKEHMTESTPILFQQQQQHYGTDKQMSTSSTPAVCFSSPQPSTSYEYVPLQSEDDCCKKHNKEISHRRKKVKRKKVPVESKPSSSSQKTEIELKQDQIDRVEDGKYDDKIHVQCHLEVGEPCNKNSTTATGLLIALLVHSLLEGMAIGVQPNSARILLVLAAVCCHKFVVAFCLGVELASSGLRAFRFVTAMAVFSLGAPLGVMIGMWVKDSSDETLSMAAPYIQAVAGGSLLYVTTCEVLPREKSKWQHRSDHKFAGILQLMSVVFGFTFIVLLNILLVSDHTSGDRPVNNSLGV